jgi:adenylate cyclase
MGAGTTALPFLARRAREVGDVRSRPERAVFCRIALAQSLAAFVGAVDVFVLLHWVLPVPSSTGFGVRDEVTAIVYVPLACLVGTLWGGRMLQRTHRWLDEGRPPTAAEQRAVLRVPLRCAGISATLWAAGAVLFFVLNVGRSAEQALYIAETVLMGGLTMSALSYLLSERLMRPVTALALAEGPPTRAVGPGVTGRLLLAWAFATGVPLVGMVWVAVDVLVDQPVDSERLAVTMAALSGAALLSGLVTTLLVAKSLADPLTAVRRTVKRIEAGDLGAEVRVDDGSEVGLLQAGVNRMAAGLREREQLRELFGRHVGEDVARAALERGAALGGEVRDVAVLFVDVVGSTTLAARRPPEEVVALLNRFFAVVVEVTGRHGGWVNKFEGDAALVVFGCPAPHDDCAGAALAAARELRDRLALAVPGVRVGIGVSAGPCVAGNVGAEQRYEYTVIGDPVNEAARLSDLAKHRPERVLASAAVLERTREKRGWRLGDRVELRGRAEPTRLAVPA